MKKIYFLLVLLIIFSDKMFSQITDYQSKMITVDLLGKVNVTDVKPGYDFQIHNLEGVIEGNKTYRQHLMKLKILSKERFPRKPHLMAKTMEGAGSLIDTPVIHRNFIGNAYNWSVPNDNTLAISNDNQLISAINTNIWFFDLDNDTIIKKVSLKAFSDTLSGISQHQYDPKLIYDPKEDRFIIVYLAGSSADTSTHILVGFSATSDMTGDWNFYALPGNPIAGDTSWTDYPAIALTEDELFITGNLLRYGGSWQKAFKQTVIWQVDKFSGYNGNATLDTRLWHDIIFDGTNIRNIHPVKGGDKLLGPDIYLMSNRNFSVYSDSVFLMHISGTMNDPDVDLSVNYLSAQPGYGAPPDAEQPGSGMLATNDARVLGAFLFNNHIQFVSNSIDTTTGLAAIYHGVIQNVSDNPVVKGKILSDPPVEYGYPNISFSGNTPFSQQSIIGFNHSADTVRPGVSAYFYDGSGGYSERVVIKHGEKAINILTGDYERWGDYTGNQRKYNEPGKVWISGMYGWKSGNFWRLGTQIAELSSPIIEIPYVSQGEKLDVALYPNPFSNQFVMEFVIDNDEQIIIELFDIYGRSVSYFYDGIVQKGKNVLMFNTLPLSQGTYILRVNTADGETLFTSKVVSGGQ